MLTCLHTTGASCFLPKLHAAVWRHPSPCLKSTQLHLPQSSEPCLAGHRGCRLHAGRCRPLWHPAKRTGVPRAAELCRLCQADPGEGAGRGEMQPEVALGACTRATPACGAAPCIPCLPSRLCHHAGHCDFHLSCRQAAAGACVPARSQLPSRVCSLLDGCTQGAGLLCGAREYRLEAWVDCTWHSLTRLVSC